MPYSRRLQYGVRTLLLVMLVLGIAPKIAHRFVQWRQDRLWNALETGKHRRDEALSSGVRTTIVGNKALRTVPTKLPSGSSTSSRANK
jgi:hypothetical protein